MHQQNRRADQNQRTSIAVVLPWSLQEDAVCPHAHVPGRRKIAQRS